MLERLQKAFKSTNKKWFDEMLPDPVFLTTNRGKYSIRYIGNNRYSVNIYENVTENDLIVEMVYQFYDKRHYSDYIDQLMHQESQERGWKNYPITLYEGTERPAARTSMRKYVCSQGCTIVRCATQLNATCNKCGAEFKEEKQNEYR